MTAPTDLKPKTEGICLDQAQKLAQDMDGDLLMDDCTKFVSPSYGQKSRHSAVRWDFLNKEIF